MGRNLFYESKNMLCTEKYFSSVDLIYYAESLLKEMKFSRALETSNYGWLRSRDCINTTADLARLKPLILKMSPENCTILAVHLEKLIEANTSPDDLLTSFQKLLEQRYSIQMMAENLKRAKEKKNVKRVNKVHPELVPKGRLPTVSFILTDDIALEDL